MKQTTVASPVAGVRRAEIRGSFLRSAMGAREVCVCKQQSKRCSRHDSRKSLQPAKCGEYFIRRSQIGARAHHYTTLSSNAPVSTPVAIYTTRLNRAAMCSRRMLFTRAHPTPECA